MRLTHYLALGDSISIDLYPSLDETNTPDQPLGAASVLARFLTANHNPHIEFTNRTRDGALISHARQQAGQSTHLAEHGAGLLITLTAGGNDISFSAMSALDRMEVQEWLDAELSRITAAWSALVADLIYRFPAATIIVNTSYDPTEGTGTFGGVDVAGAWEGIAKMYTPGRELLSAHVREAVRTIRKNGSDRLLLADIREHFRNHGVTVPEADRWYWREFMIEPNAEGARQIARLWIDALHQQTVAEFYTPSRESHVLA